MFVFIVDVGTSSMRGILYNGQAHVHMQKQILYRPTFFADGRVEQDPADWHRGLLELGRALADYIDAGGCRPDVIALTAQRSSVIPLSAEGKPLGPAIMWQDRRTVSMADEFADRDHEIFIRTGSRINPVFSGCKMVWLHRHQPTLYQAAHKLAVIPDYLMYLLTGRLCTDTTYASRSLLLNLEKSCWDEELLRLFDLDPDKLCELVPPGSICGTLSTDFAAQCGLPAGIPVVSAGGDQQCAALGLGILQNGDAELTTGTGAFLLSALDQLPASRGPDVIFGASAIPGHFLAESSILTCCSAFDWYVREFYPECCGQNFCTVNEEISRAEGTKLLVLPYFQGRATPDWNSRASGSVHGLSLATTRGEIARAILEGICHEIRCNLDNIQRCAGPIRNIRIGGGLTKSPIFPQIEADILQKDLTLYSNPEATALGAWVQGAMALGGFASYQEALQTARAGDNAVIFHPNTEKAAFYEERHQEFERLYRVQYQC